MEKIRKGDEVIILTGKDKGKRGTVLHRAGTDFVVVEGINLAKKHQRPNPAQNVTGGIIDKAMPIQISNVAIFNPTTQKADRIGFKVLKDGKKIRIFKSSSEPVNNAGSKA